MRLIPILTLAITAIGIVATLILIQSNLDSQVFAKDPISQVQGTSFITYTRSIFDEGQVILPTTIPENNEIISDTKQLKMHAARNESESLQLGIYNNGTDALRNVTVRVSKMKLKDGTAELSPADVRVVKILKVRKNSKQNGLEPSVKSPEVLVPATQEYRNYLDSDEFGITAQTSKAWIITLKTDPATFPGTYEGQVMIESENAKKKSYPITFIVSGMELLKHPIKVSGFYYKPLKSYLDCRTNPCSEISVFDYVARWATHEDEYNLSLQNYRNQVNADLTMLKEFGIRSNVYTIRLAYTMRYENSVLEVDFGYLDVLFDEIKNAGMNDRPIVLFRTVDASVYETIQKLIGRDNVDEEYMQLVRDIEQRRLDKGMSQLYWYPIDEPFHKHSSTPEEGVKRRAWLTKLVPLIRSAISSNKIYVTVPYDIWFDPPEGTQDYKTTYGSLIDILSFNRKITEFNHTTRDELREYLDSTGKFGYMYVNHRLGSLYEHRLEHGLFFRNLGLKANIPFTYQDIWEDPYSDATADEKGRGDWINAYPDLLNKYKSLPSLRLIAIREGIDDLNYLYTLSTAKKASGDTTLVAEAQKLLREVSDTINADTPSVVGIKSRISPAQMDAWRRDIAKLVVQLGQPQKTPTVNENKLLDEEVE
ncbi:DUF4091 domain-containing protein [Candidatus Gottesmanbacteria bacterium]|nr:DUF4091 domain-containing protein [Candidatus Gottesmanbacteria bacterium]